MPTEADLLAAAARLHARSMPSDAEELGLFRKAIDPTYWQGLLPTMAVEDQRGIAPAERAGAPSDRAAQAANHLEAHGYFQMPPTLGEELTDRMATAVELLRGVGWPLVFTYIYDEFWAVWRAPSVVSLLRGHFGGGIPDRRRLDLSGGSTKTREWVATARRQRQRRRTIVHMDTAHRRDGWQWLHVCHPGGCCCRLGSRRASWIGVRSRCRTCATCFIM